MRVVGFYVKHILPYVIDIGMKNPAATRLRGEWVPKAVGDVLEVGIGSGLNLPFYTDQVSRIYGLDPSRELQRIARRRAAGLSKQVGFLPQLAEVGIPLPTESIDTVVLTWTLCSMTDPHSALQEVGRVLKRHGQLIFIEHGRSPERPVEAWQDRLTPLWKKVAGGCHLNRDVHSILEHAEFQVIEGEEGYLTGPRLLTYTYRGIAQR